MAQLLVNDLDEAVGDRLRALAERHGRSVEEEAREILRRAAAEPPIEPSPADEPGLGTRLAATFAGCGGIDFEIPELRGRIHPQVPTFDP